MIASAHIAAGVVIGLVATRFMEWRPGRVLAALPAGVLVHLAIDFVPHADYNDIVGRPLLAIVGVELMVTGAILFVLLRHRAPVGWFPPVASGVVGSALPDVKFFAPLVMPPDVAAHATELGERLHHAIHAPRPPFVVGTATQVVGTLLLLLFLAAFPGTRSR